jgi:hypothetical protein
MYESLYWRILGFTLEWSPPCVEDQPHVTFELSFTMGAHLDIGGIWSLPVIVMHVFILIPL